MSKLTLQQLESHLWSSADILRGSVNVGDYKSYILGLLFLKRINDVFKEHKYKEIFKHEEDSMLPIKSEFYHFYISKTASWEEICKCKSNIGSAINKAFESIENENYILSGVLTPIDFNRKEILPDKVLQRLLEHFSSLDLGNNNLPEPDMLGRAYEYLIKMFADDAGKKGGEFYTPSKVVELIVKLIKPIEQMSIYDPTCGSGGMLVQSVDYIREQGGDPTYLSLFGQEKNIGTWSIAKMNLLLHELPNHKLEKGDTIRQPKFLENGELMLFDRIIANPPFSLKNWGHEEVKYDLYDRFQYGFPPKNTGDYAFIQHIIASLKSDGICGVIMPLGVLFRGGAESKIRHRLIEQDLLEAVIGLPSNLFHGTSIPTCILIFNKKKPENRKGHVLFIAEDSNSQQGNKQNALRDEDIQNIVSAFEKYKDIEKYARIVPTKNIKINNYNLSINNYVNKLDEERSVDIKSVLKEIKDLEDRQVNIKKKLNVYFKELGIGQIE